ncbi:MAG TPA: hypothetical protein V6D22_17095 [Candidatus Obscuribacterales bacterium]
MQDRVLHLPGHLAAAEKQQPETVAISRSIEPRQALEMIANQQGKIVRLLGFLKNHDHEIDKARAKSMKATHVAARLAAENKCLREAATVIADSFRKVIDQLEEEQKFLKAAICCFLDNDHASPVINESAYNKYVEWELEIDYPGNGTALLTIKDPANAS